MRLGTYLFTLLIFSGSTTLGSVTYQNLPSSPTQLFSGNAVHGYLIYDVNGGHFIENVAAVASTTIAGNVATTTYTYPETPDTQPYPYMSSTGPIYYGNLYAPYLAGSSQESLVVGPSTLLATADWNFVVPSQELSTAAGISFNMTVTNEPAVLSLDQNVNALVIVFNLDSGEVFANNNGGTYFNSYQLSLDPGHYQIQYSLYDQSSLSGHYSISVVPEVSSAYLLAGGLFCSAILLRRQRRSAH